MNEQDDLDGLLKDMQNLGLALTDEETKMQKFIKDFGENKDPEEFAEYLYDYCHNPEEYDIDIDSDYYMTIEDYYEEISEYKRFRAGTIMNMGMHPRWSLEAIEFSDIYELYIKMSNKYK